MATEEDEISVLHQELKWLLREEVHHVFEDIRHTLQECSERFPIQTGAVHDSEIKQQRMILSSPNGSSQMKCMVTLRGDSICEADVNFKHKHVKDQHHIFKTSFNPDRQWKLQQIQDAGNHLCNALFILSKRDATYEFKSAQEVLLLLDELMACLMKCRTSLAMPKRKTLQDLITNKNMQIFYPVLPNDVALSFYVHASKLILAMYHLHTNNQQKVEITARFQVESVVQWLNEAIVFFTLALQQCQQLKDKIIALCQYDGMC
ncbi:protein rogdi homolog [Patella vulgata]|uniref:protein rogdi homolog n=1 Tax=Patella vulgata TaxID=6465 RepID=UPI00217F9B18|nr:protein rogdi homolog [Patella vulgata]